jgi:aryl-alcohol dehydrogenase-like predicted oxidoreductase
VLAKHPHAVPIPGTKRRTYVEQNAAAADIILSAADVADLDALFTDDAVAGARYPEEMMRLLEDN